MGIVVSLLLVGVGAILIWAVTGEAEGIDVDAVGVILIVIGIISFGLTLIFWSSWWGRGGFRRATYVEGAPAARRTYVEDAPPQPVERRTVVEDAPARPVERRTVVEEEEVPPPGPPPPPP